MQITRLNPARRHFGYYSVRCGDGVGAGHRSMSATVALSSLRDC